jgi:hypothetical protein
LLSHKTSEVLQNHYLYAIDENKKFKFYLKFQYDGDCSYCYDKYSEEEPVNEKKEYEGIFFSRDKESVIKFVERKKRAEEERKNDTYLKGLGTVLKDLQDVTDHLKEEENRELVRTISKRILTLIQTP